MRRVLLLLARIALAVVFLWAAIAKLREPWLQFAATIDAMQILPGPAVVFVARTLPLAELVLGLLLLSGNLTRYVAPVATCLLLAFFGILLRSYLRGMEIDCGCFGPGETLGPKTLARDGIFVALSIWLTVEAFRSRRSRLA